ncbi:MAG: hypothetical protein HZB53_06445 [Chloroflexi bacterium]|nr:hypothetical protein [Chloroflexota bacterium]
MRRSRTCHAVLSTLVIIAMLAVDVARVLPPPVAEAGRWQPEVGEPPAPSQASSPQSLPALAQARLLFAPAIDADGDPATNPVADEPVPVVKTLGQTSGLIALAAQLGSTNQRARLIGNPVTFRVWRDEQLWLERTIRSDAWGAVTLKLAVPETNHNYSYQASAPGYGETEVRPFTFDASRAAVTLETDGTHLSYQLNADGRIVLTLQSPLALDAERDEAALTIARRPNQMPDVSSVALQAALKKADDAKLYLPFPRVRLLIVDSHTAQIELQLPPGEYRFVGSLAVNSTAAYQFVAEPVHATLDHAWPVPAPADAIWVATFEHERGQTLVRYDAPPGGAAFALVDTGQRPPLEFAWDESTTVVKAWRTGPFDWEQEVYRVESDPAALNSDTRVTLDDFDYDPIARRYALAFRSRAAQTVSHNLLIEVLGADDAVIQQQTIPVALPPGNVSKQSIQVPAELGRPHGLRVSAIGGAPATGPLLTARLAGSDHIVSLAPASGGGESFALETNARQVVARAHPLESAVQKKKSDPAFSLFAQFQLKFALNLLEVEIGTLAYTYEPGDWEGNLTPWRVVVEQLVKGLIGSWWSDSKLVLASGSLNAAFDFGGMYTAKAGTCTDEADEQAWENRVNERMKALADDIDGRLADLGGEEGEEIDTPPTPVSLIFVWASGAFRQRTKADAGNLSISISSRFEFELAINAGWKIPIGGTLEAMGKFYKILGWFGVVADVVAALGTITHGPNGKSCQKDGDGNGDDDPGNPDPPDQGPADDRQDVWQNTGQLYEGETLDATITNLYALVQKARQQGLARAEAFLTMPLRKAELAVLTSDGARYDQYLHEVAAIVDNDAAYLRGVISGTIPITPGLTITDALMTSNDQASAAISGLSYAVELQHLTDEVDVAQRGYLALYGQELELEQELGRLATSDTIGVVASGFVKGSLDALSGAGLPAQLISLWPGTTVWGGQTALYLPPAVAPRALIVPSGGLHMIAAAPEARAWLEEYVQGGGLLIVFTQAFGTDWASLPGGQVRAVGYDEDQRCEQESVRATMPSNWLVWIGDRTPDIQVDGAFTAWPSDAQPLLLRTSGYYEGYPAMLEYPFGQGRVLATTAYGDWATQTRMGWGDDWQMTRSILIRAYLLSRGQDVQAVQTVEPDTDVTITFPLTNSTSIATTQIQVELTLIPYAGTFNRSIWSVATTITATLAPGASQMVSATLHTPRAMRGVHNWTQVGLFHVRARLSGVGNPGFTTWGPFLHIHSPIAPPQLALSLAAERAAARPFETVVVTATVHNYSVIMQTAVLRGQLGLPNTPITFTVPPGSAMDYPYALSMDQSKHLVATISNDTGQLLATSSLLVYVGEANLRPVPNLPAQLAAGTPFSVTVSNQPNLQSPSSNSLSSTLVLTLTTPAGSAIWNGVQDVPPLMMLQSARVSYTLGDPGPIALGTYQIEYSLLMQGRLAAHGLWDLPARPSIGSDFDQPYYHVRDTVSFTATLRNAEHFDLNPVVTVTVPALGLVAAQPVALPVHARATIPLSFALPMSMTTGAYEVHVTAMQGSSVTETFAFNVPPSRIEARLESGPYHAGQPLPVTLLNLGGLDTTAGYTITLSDNTGRVIAATTGSLVITTGAQINPPLNVPAGAATGEYILRVSSWDQGAQRASNLLALLHLDGLAAQVDVHTDQASYSPGQSILAQGQVTANGDLSGTLALRVTRAETRALTVMPNERVNTDDEIGFVTHYDPQITLDAAGNAHAVWIEPRPSAPTGIACTGGISDYVIYFASRTVTGTWSQAEQVNSNADSCVPRRMPAMTIDASGAVHMAWADLNQSILPGLRYARRAAGTSGTWSTEESVTTTVVSSITLGVDLTGTLYMAWGNPGSANIQFATRAAGAAGAWSAVQLVNDSSTGVRGSPDLAVDAAGQVYLAWQDSRNGNADIYFATRYVTGTWGANERVITNTAAQNTPALAVDSSGRAYLVWMDNRSGNAIFASARSVTGTWETEKRVEYLPNAKSNPDLAVDGTGNLLAIWQSWPYPNPYEIWYATRPATATAWITGTLVSQSDSTAASSLTMDAAGNSRMAFLWNKEVNSMFRPANGAWGSRERVSPPRGGALQRYSRVGVDESGNAYAVWGDARDSTAGNKYDLYFATRPLTGTWSVGTRVNAVTGTLKLGSGLAADAQGDAYAIWSDTRTDTNGDIYFAYRPVTGTWGLNEPVNDGGFTSAQLYPRIALDAAGNAYAIWADKRNCSVANAYDFYFAYRPVTGTWSTNQRVNDVPCPTISADVGTLDFAVDAAGNAYAVWRAYVSSAQVLFAYRPAGGVWSASEQLTNVPGAPANGQYPTIAVDQAGTAYVVYGNPVDGLLYFTYRLAGGAWSVAQTIADATSQGWPSLSVDAQANLWVAWVRVTGAPSASSVQAAWRPAGGAWSSPVIVPQPFYAPNNTPYPNLAAGPGRTAVVIWSDNRPDANGLTDEDIYFARLVAPTPETALWTRTVSVSTANSQVISETVGVLDLQPGKYWLQATLQSALSQTLGASRYPFYIYPVTAQLTLQTDQLVYRPGQAISVSGRLTNTDVTTNTFTLLVKADSQTILSQTVSLGAGTGTAYTASLTASNDLLLEATAGQARATEALVIAAPQGTASLSVPGTASYAPFEAAVTIGNTGRVDANIVVSIGGGAPQALAVSPGQTTVVTRSLSVSQATVLTATVRGDLALDLAQSMLWGLDGAVRLIPPATNFKGTIPVGYVVTGTGTLLTLAQLRFALDTGQVVSQSVALLPGQTLTGSLLVDIPAGRHQLIAQLLDERSVLLDSDALALAMQDTAAPAEASIRIIGVTVTPAGGLSAPAPRKAAAGQSFNVAVTVANDGASAPVILALQVFDAPQQWIVTPTAFLTETFAFSLSVPSDLPAGEYTGQVVVADQRQPFKVTTSGTDLSMNLRLDQPFYLSGDPVLLTVTLTERAGLSGSYHLSLGYLNTEQFVTVTVSANQVIQYAFAFSATTTSRASMMLSNLPAPGEAGQRTIMIDSLPVQVIESAGGSYVTFDKSAYRAGDTINMTVHVNTAMASFSVFGPVEMALGVNRYLVWTAPRDALGRVVTGTHTLTFTLPTSIKSNQYTFMAMFNGRAQPYRVDVQGWSVTTRHITLDRQRYGRYDPITATVEFFNEGSLPINNLRVNPLIFTPDGDVLRLASIAPTINLQPGLNVITVSGVLSAPVAGPYRLLVNIGIAGETWRVAGAAAQFDVGWTHLVDLTTDHGNYAPGQPGAGRLVVFGIGPTHLVVTATNGSTLLDTTRDLTGFATFNFAVPTTTMGDYRLFARSTDQDGNGEQLTRAYAVPFPADATAPAISLTYPNTRTIITTNAPTMTLSISGNASDNSGYVAVLINGKVITPTAGGSFALNVVVHQGANLISAAALDRASNIAYTPVVPVYLLPAHNLTSTANRVTAAVGDPVTFRTILTSTGVLSDVTFSQYLSPLLVNSATIIASSGSAAVGPSSTGYYMSWLGDVTGSQPVTITLQATVVNTGTLTSTAIVRWGWGFTDQRTQQINVTNGGVKIFLPLVRKN